jgi:hypothetical protein
LEDYKQGKLYHKLMLLHYQLGSSEVQEAMAEPVGWRPEPDPNLSLETQVTILAEQFVCDVPAVCTTSAMNRSSGQVRDEKIWEDGDGWAKLTGEVY